MLQQSLSTTFDTASTSSYGQASLSWSSWSTSTTTPDDESDQTTTFIAGSTDATTSCCNEYLHDECPTLRTLSSIGHYLQRKTSFVTGASDFDGCELSIASNRLEDVIRCSCEDKSQKFLVFSSSFPYHIEWANSEWSKISGWSSDEVIGWLRQNDKLLANSKSVSNVLYLKFIPGESKLFTYFHRS
jgi:hypothetical protein